MKNIFFYSCLVATTIGLTACGGKKEDHDHEHHHADSTAAMIDSSQTAVNQLAEFKFHTLMANIPSPLETIDQFPNAGLTFNKELLNSTDNAKKYSSAGKKALNYGIYATDLGYLSAFEQNQELIKYFTATRKLAESLGASSQFDKVAATRFESNMGNKDSLMLIMDEAYAATEEYLKTNERLEAASLMLAGSLIESQYILLESVKNVEKTDKNKQLFSKIYEQKRHIESLNSLLAEYEKNADVKSIKADIEKIKTVFDGVKSADLTKEEMNKLAETVSAARKKMVA